MGTREDFIRQYAEADVNGRMEIILRNYSRFLQMIEGYEECLSIIIQNERDYNRKASQCDLGVRVQTSKISKVTELRAMENVLIQDAIRSGDIETALEGTDDYEKHAVEIRTLRNMREDYRIVSNQFHFLDDSEGKIFTDYISKKRNMATIASDEGVAYETIRWRLKQTRRTVKVHAKEFLDCKYKHS